MRARSWVFITRASAGVWTRRDPRFRQLRQEGLPRLIRYPRTVSATSASFSCTSSTSSTQPANTRKGSPPPHGLPSAHTHTYTITATATATVPTTVHQEERPLIVAQMIPPNRNPILSHFPYSQHRHFRYAPAIFYSILSYSVLFTWHRWQLISQYLVS